MLDFNLLIPTEYPADNLKLDIAKQFISGKRPKYLFGLNKFAESIINEIKVNGIVDEYQTEQTYKNVPIVPLSELPHDAIIISCIVGVHPKTAIRKLEARGLTCLDYYAFQKYSSLPLTEVMFMGAFKAEFKKNKNKYQRIFELLQDDVSKSTFIALLKFRLSYELQYLSHFEDRQIAQYFEDFLGLTVKGESFLDVGSYDGFTSMEFARRCPEYERIHIFEPEPKNMVAVEKSLKDFRNITFHKYGASDRKATLMLNSNGSSSAISNEGTVSINVDKIDHIIFEPISFIKMDIEGGEIQALIGAQECIKKFHPKIAISVYHKADDLWRIPETILNIRSDYHIFLRHYTEGITESVMFFVPTK